MTEQERAEAYELLTEARRVCLRLARWARWPGQQGGKMECGMAQARFEAADEATFHALNVAVHHLGETAARVGTDGFDYGSV